jgi:hypothetical protein
MSSPIPTPQAFLYQAPTGVPGDIVSSGETNVEPAMLVASGSPSVFPQAFGIPVQYAEGPGGSAGITGTGVTQWQASVAASAFAGVLVREAPGISGNFAQDLNDTTPNPNVPQGLAVRGYVSVLCPLGTPVRGGVVYICNATGGPGNIGDFQAVSNSYNVALSSTQAEWAIDGTDANFNTTIRIAR